MEFTAWFIYFMETLLTFVCSPSGTVTMAMCYGIGFYLFGIIFLAIRAYKIHWAWSIGIILLPAIGLIFAIMHWSEAKKPVLYAIVCLACFIGTVILRGLLCASYPEYGDTSYCLCDQMRW